VGETVTEFSQRGWPQGSLGQSIRSLDVPDIEGIRLCRKCGGRLSPWCVFSNSHAQRQTLLGAHPLPSMRYRRLTPVADLQPRFQRRKDAVTEETVLKGGTPLKMRLGLNRRPSVEIDLMRAPTLTPLAEHGRFYPPPVFGLISVVWPSDFSLHYVGI
jgi:hypothetical protein